MKYKIMLAALTFGGAHVGCAAAPTSDSNQKTENVATASEALSCADCQSNCDDSDIKVMARCRAACARGACACQPNCSGVACGASNGCSGTCQPPNCVCTPNCSGKACGVSDGCGGTCGPKPCPCVPQCAGATCGAPDGCGNICTQGTCAGTALCGAGGIPGQCTNVPDLLLFVTTQYTHATTIAQPVTNTFSINNAGSVDVGSIAVKFNWNVANAEISTLVTDNNFVCHASLNPLFELDCIDGFLPAYGSTRITVGMVFLQPTDPNSTKPITTQNITVTGSVDPQNQILEYSEANNNCWEAFTVTY